MVYNIRDFIKDARNATPAFVEAISLMQSGDTLLIGNGKYDISDPGKYPRDRIRHIDIKHGLIRFEHGREPDYSEGTRAKHRYYHS